MALQELQQVATEMGFDLIGTSPAYEFAGVPCWSQTAIIVGLACLDPAYDFELYVEEAGRRRFSKWAYERLVAGTARLALGLCSSGHRAEALTFDDSLATIDLKAAAVRSGLGVRGLNGLVLTRRFGPRVRFGALFTELKMPSSQPMADYFCASCTLCIAACPTQALGPGGLDRTRCLAEFEPDARLSALQRELLRFPTPHTRMQCAACVDACPIGKRVPTRFWGLDPH